MKPDPDAPGLFRALGDPIRLRLMALLIEARELCVCELCDALQEIQPKVSRHLATLRAAGLVDVRCDGRWKYYSLREPRSDLHRGLLRCLRTCADDLGAALDAAPGARTGRSARCA